MCVCLCAFIVLSIEQRVEKKKVLYDRILCCMYRDTTESNRLTHLAQRRRRKKVENFVTIQHNGKHFNTHRHTQTHTHTGYRWNCTFGANDSGKQYEHKHEKKSNFVQVNAKRDRADKIDCTLFTIHKCASCQHQHQHTNRFQSKIESTIESRLLLLITHKITFFLAYSKLFTPTQFRMFDGDIWNLWHNKIDVMLLFADCFCTTTAHKHHTVYKSIWRWKNAKKNSLIPQTNEIQCTKFGFREKWCVFLVLSLLLSCSIQVFFFTF